MEFIVHYCISVHMFMHTIYKNIQVCSPTATAVCYNISIQTASAGHACSQWRKAEQ